MRQAGSPRRAADRTGNLSFAGNGQILTRGFNIEILRCHARQLCPNIKVVLILREIERRENPGFVKKIKAKIILSI